MKLTSNTDFFIKSGHEPEMASDSIAMSNSQQEGRRSIESKGEIVNIIEQTTEILECCGFRKMSNSVNLIQSDITRERFVISVVGEFNHGKSTFLNRLLENAAMLPIGDLPTTAILTRIRYANQPKMAVFDENGGRKVMLEIKPESWEGLVANNFGKEEPKGSVIVGVPNSWIGKHNLEIVDCPGAGDLSEERAKVIGDMLNRTDGAIIALNATAAMSKSEKLFIKNRILAHKTPFTLIIINKLDLVKKEERCKVVKYIMDVLALNNMNIPVYVPYDIEMPDDIYQNIIGIDKVKKVIVEWIENPERQTLVEKWVKARISEIVRTAIETLSEKEKLLKLNDDKRLEVIALKKQKLDKLEIEWNELTLKLQAKSNDCYSRFLEKVEEYTFDVTERMQYEASHTTTPEKWWNEDYPYRLKVELANMSVSLENEISRIVSNDAKWFNDILSLKFQSLVQVGNINIADKDEYRSNKSRRTLEFENLNKNQNYARVGTVALSIALFPVLGIFATMGVGTAGALITASVFKKKVDSQRTAIKEAIAIDIPAVVAQATTNSEKRIQKLYEDMLDDSEKKKQAWIEAQTKTILDENPTVVQDELNNIIKNIRQLNDILSKTM